MVRCRVLFTFFLCSLLFSSCIPFAELFSEKKKVEVSFCDSNSSNYPFANGLGTEADPYTICTAAQLDEVRNYLSAYHKLMQNIDMENASFERIGTNNPGPAFSGIFDGNNFSISNLSIPTPDPAYPNWVGFFGQNDGTIKNLNLVNITVLSVGTTENKVGGLAGMNNGGTIDNCSVSGTIYGAIDVGGLLGSQSGGTISNSHAVVTVYSSANNTGGLVGFNGSSTITNSYANVSVYGGGNSLGGLVGESNSSTITGSYATGLVETTAVTNGVGGLVGVNQTGLITSSFTSSMTVTASDSNFVGGLVGYKLGTGTISKSYVSSGNVTGNDYVGGFVGYNSGGLLSFVFESYATGNVTGVEGVGGFVGINGTSSTNIRNSYAKVAVTSTGVGLTYSGGFVGDNSGIILYSYSTGTVSATNVYGGFGGDDSGGGGIFTDCFWDTDTSGITAAGFGSGLITSQLQNQAFYPAGWDFASIWIMSGYPILQWQ